MDNQYIFFVYIIEICLFYMMDEWLVQDIFYLKGFFYCVEIIMLFYEYNIFFVSFVVLSYEDFLKNCYFYCLKGVDKEWVINFEQNMVFYINLFLGKYEFEVWGLNNDYKWNDQIIFLLIVVMFLWWLIIWVYCVYIFFFFGFVYYVGWYWNWYVKKKYKCCMEEYQIMKEKEVYKLKISFFINLVYEICILLSLIWFFFEKLLEDK